MVAINVCDRSRYAEMISSLLATDGEVLIQCINREKGPPGAPHNLSGEELASFYPTKTIEELEEYELDDPVKKERFGRITGTCFKIK